MPPYAYGYGYARYKPQNSKGNGSPDWVFASSDTQWTVTERPEEANTKRLRINLTVDPPSGKKFIWYRGPNANGTPTTGTFGSFTQISPGNWQANAANPTNSAFDYVAVFTAPTAVADPVAWNAAGVMLVSSVKTFVPSGLPLAADVSYTVDGSGTAAMAYFGARGVVAGSGQNGVTPWRAVDQGRWRVVGSGTYTTFTDADSLAMTGLSSTQDLLFSWHNVNGWGDETPITIIADPPKFAVGDWALNDAANPVGDGLLAAISATPTTPSGWVASGVQYRKNVSGAGYGAAASLPLSGLINTTALTSTAVQLRMLYDKGPSAWGDEKTQTPTAYVVPFPTVVSRAGGQQTSSVASHTITPPTHQANDLILIAYVPDGVPTLTLNAGWSQNVPGAMVDPSLCWLWKFADAPGETCTITFNGSEASSWVVYIIRGARDVSFGPRFSNMTGSAVTPDAPSYTVGASEKIVWITATSASGDSTQQSGAPSGWSNPTYGNGSTSANTDCASAELSYEGTTVDAPVWPVATKYTMAQTVAVLPGVRSIIPSVLTATTMVGVAAEGEYLSFTPATYAGPPAPTETMYVERTNNGGSSWSTVATVTDRSTYHLYLDSGAVGYAYRGRTEAANTAGNGPSSATSTTAVVAASPGLLPPQTVTRGSVTMEVRGLSSFGWTEDGVFVGVPAATNYTIVSATPAEQQVSGENNYWINGHQKNGAANAPTNPYDQRWRTYLSGWSGSTSLGVSTSFNASLMAAFPIRMTSDDVWTKFVSVTDTAQGSRRGSALQWLACMVGTAAPTTNRFAPPAWKFAGRSNNLINIDVDAYLATLPTYAWTGTQPYTLETEIQRFERFDPSFGRFTDATQGGGYEKMSPLNTGADGQGAYGQYRAEANSYLLMHLIGNIATTAQKRRILVAAISHGIQWDASLTIPADGAHYQFHQPWVALARYLRGLAVSTLASDAPGNLLGQYFKWDSTLLATQAVSGGDRNYYLRTVTAVDNSGANPVITYARGSYTEYEGMPVTGLLVRRNGDGATAAVVSGGLAHPGSASSFTVTIDAQPGSAFLVGDQHYFPSPITPVAGDPEWAVRGSAAMNRHNASTNAYYRNLARGAGSIMCLRAMGLWPTSGAWAAAEAYAERTMAGNYPSSGALKYPGTNEDGWVATNWTANWASIKTRPVLVS